ncbi:universal stress protein A family protein C25B2.10 [Lactarius tabidus]
MAEHPGSIAIPPQQPLRSAMKHSSRPTTPSASSPPISSPFFQPSPIPPVPQIPVLPTASPVQSTVSTLNSPIPAASPSASGTLLPPSMITQSPTATIAGPNASQGYTSKVSFDTFENPVASMFSFTLQVKSDGYDRTPSTRVFLCASSPDESGRHALDWAIEGLVQDGDELIVFRGIDQDDLEKDHDVVRDEARDLMHRIQEQCVEVDPERKLSIIVEYIAGKVTTTIDRLIALYRPDSVVVGSRGARKMKQAFGAAFGAQSMGGVSKYCLSHSPVPVIVVRPESKVRKTLDKRRADPKRGIHFDDRLQSPRSNSGPGLSITSTMSR